MLYEVITVTTGADGTAVGLATADPLADVHPPTVWVTV